MSTPVLEGYGVRLRPLTLEDIPALATFANAEVGQFFSERIDTPEAIEAYVKTGVADATAQAFIVESEGEIVGHTRLFRLNFADRNGEIGHTFYAQKVWRTHVNTASKLLLLTHAFETLEFLRVSFRTDSRNIRSQTAIARLGAKLEGTNRNDKIVWNGYIRSSVNFSIIREEWPEVKVGLLSKLQ